MTARDKSRADIMWTHDALARFWDFLRSLRGAGALGPISLSFHAAPRADESSSFESTGAGRPPETPFYATNSTPASFIRTTLLSSDHFKVYHDSRYSMQIRNVLDAWSFETEDKPQDGSRSPTKVKIRVLKGAVLTLVDERSKGILTC